MISDVSQKIVFRMHWFKGTQGIYQNRRLRKAITDLLQKLYDRKCVVSFVIFSSIKPDIP